MQVAETAPTAPVAETAQREAAHVASGYRPSVTWLDVERARTGEPIPDPRDISLGRLFVECRKTARRKGKGLRRSEHESVAAEMALRIVRRNGNRAPLRRVFLDVETGAVSREGTNLLLGALRAALDAPSLWRETPPQEEPTDPGLPLSALAVQESRAEAGRVVVPDASAEELARILDLPESAARVIVCAGSFLVEVNGKTGRTWRVDVDGAASALGIGADSLASMLKRGKRQLRERYPDPAHLMEALQAGAEAAIEMRADHVRESADWHASTGRDAQEVREAARAYVGALEETPHSPWGAASRAVRCALMALGAVDAEYRKRGRVSAATDPGATLRATRRNLRAPSGRPVYGPARRALDAPKRVAAPTGEETAPTCYVPALAKLIYRQRAEAAHAHRIAQREVHGYPEGL